MQKKVLDYMEECHMVEKGEKILAAVSGGADSVCLLSVLLALQEELGILLCAVHVEHGIRGEESEKDALFVENLCKRHGVPCKIYHCQAASYAREHKMTLEEGARSLRYHFFEQAAKEFGAGKVAVAHNQNDCAETVLFHLVRGAGLQGMCGILPVRGKVIRPLLCVGRDEIESYLALKGQGFCQDKTNAELDYTRNKLRHQVFPVLGEVNGQAVAHINQAAALAAQAMELVGDATKTAEKMYISKTGRGLFMPSGILEEKAIVQKSLAHKLLAGLSGSSRDISGLHVQQLLGLFEKQAGKRLDFPYGVSAERVYGGVLLELKAAAPKGQKGAGAAGDRDKGQDGEIWELPVGGDLEISQYGYAIRTKILENNFQFEEIPKKMYTKWMDYDRIKGNMHLRTRQEQDYFVISPDGRQKKLKRYFIDEKVPRQQRGQVLLLAEGAHVLWAIGGRISEDVKVTKETQRVLEIQVYGGNVHE